MAERPDQQSLVVDSSENQLSADVLFINIRAPRKVLKVVGTTMTFLGAVSLAAWCLQNFLATRGVTGLVVSQVFLYISALALCLAAWPIASLLRRFRLFAFLLIALCLIASARWADVHFPLAAAPQPAAPAFPAKPGELTSQVAPNIVVPTDGYNKIISGRPIRMNVIYKCLGPQLCHNVASFETLQLLPSGDDEAVGRLKMVFRAHTSDAFRDAILRRIYLGQEVAVGSGMYKTTDEQNLTTGEVAELTSGRSRLYLLMLLVWKDSEGRAGYFQACQWMENFSKRPVIDEATIVWHDCGPVV